MVVMIIVIVMTLTKETMGSLAASWLGSFEPGQQQTAILSRAKVRGPLSIFRPSVKQTRLPGREDCILNTRNDVDWELLIKLCSSPQLIRTRASKANGHIKGLDGIRMLKDAK